MIEERKAHVIDILKSKGPCPVSVIKDAAPHIPQATLYRLLQVLVYDEKRVIKVAPTIYAIRPK